jgi:hypothetical protein
MTELDLLIKGISERIDMLTDSVATGGAKSYEEYKFMVGEIRGLSFTKQTITDLVRKLENDDE